MLMFYFYFFKFFKTKSAKEPRGAQEPEAQRVPDFGGRPPGYKLLTRDLIDERDALEKSAGTAEK